MSKLYNRYKNLKLKGDDVYLFKVGIFYISLDDDARLISKVLDLKCVPLNENITKCGFPIGSLDKYIKLLKENKIKYKIIDKLDNKEDIDKYLNKIKKIDVDNLTGFKAIQIIVELKGILNGN